MKIWQLRDENRLLKQQVVQLQAMVATQQKAMEDLKLQLEELRGIVFGKKRKSDDDDDELPPAIPMRHTPRSKGSYQRVQPQESEVTARREHTIVQCAQCGGDMRHREQRIYFEEDILVPQPKSVIKHVVERGYCGQCQRWSTAIPLPTARVVLGPHVRRMVSYLAVMGRLSYGQIQDVLKQVYAFDVSQGEIASLLANEGERLRLAYEQLKVKIRDEPSVHMDETGWNLLRSGEHGFAWTMVGGASGEAVFVLGQSRGKVNAQELLGDSTAVVVSDDYAAYRTLSNPHQLCCAHILRKLRDLARSAELTPELRDHCRTAYTTFASIYADIEQARTSTTPTSTRSRLHQRLQQFARSHIDDPAKLARIKTQIQKRTVQYLTCLRYSQVAADNNAAERSLRHLVLKRKISFGSLCARTAETMAILCSMLLTYKQRGSLHHYLQEV